MLALALFAGASLSSAHYKRKGTEDSTVATWYFSGATYKNRPLNRANRKDPVNVVFYGAGDSSPYTRDRIEQHMKDDWSTRAIGGRRWSTDSEIYSACKDDQYVGWPFYPGSDSDRTDWHGSTSARLAIGSTIRTACFSQHHARFWDDMEHDKGTGSAHTRYDWALAGVHHERPISKITARSLISPLLGCCVGHRVDRDWDRVRIEFVKGMARHCAVRRWKYHPAADDTFQNYTNWGFVARVSLRHQSEGCTGA